MPWQVVPTRELGFIEIVYCGRVTLSDVEAATAKALALAAEEGLHKFLSNLDDAEVVLSVIDIYYLPRQWEALGSNRRNKLATVLPKSSPLRREVEFHVSTSQIRGWQVHVASRRQEAIDWLLSQS